MTFGEWNPCKASRPVNSNGVPTAPGTIAGKHGAENHEHELVVTG